jgi:CubicO group peptidase (beta-lactamase class C family)
MSGDSSEFSVPRWVATPDRRRFLGLVGCAAASFARPAAAIATAIPRAEPEEVGFDAQLLARIDTLVHEGLAAKKMPGCVVAVGRGGRIAWLKAYGDRQREPTALPMTIDTLFDLASLTKPIATASSIMLLVERGQLQLSDEVAQVIPEFAAEGKRAVTIQHLLLHSSGLLPDNPIADYQDGRESALRRICALKLQAPIDAQFIYSDVNFVVLGEIVQRVSGQRLDEFCQRHLFQPLQMTETGFVPGEALRRRAAPTEKRDGRWMQGEVHDPRAYLLGGVAGHAGLFSTADDLAIFAQMLLDRGRRGDQQILSAESIDTMTRSYQLPGNRRGLGWDKQSKFSSNRGDLLSESAFGHGGFTGTVLWVDPKLDLYYLLLSNRLHPDGKGQVNPLAGRIGSVVASAVRN